MVKKIEVWKKMAQEKAIAKAEKEGYRILTNREVEKIMTDDKLRKKYKDAFPCWTGTHISYNSGATTAVITENGKERKVKLLPKDGWYLPDKFSLPTGKKSREENPKARYLPRLKNYHGLVSRICDLVYGGGRLVYASFGPSVRVRALVEKKR